MSLNMSRFEEERLWFPKSSYFESLWQKVHVFTTPSLYDLFAFWWRIDSPDGNEGFLKMKPNH